MITDYLNTLLGHKRYDTPNFFGISSAEIITYLTKKTYKNKTVWGYILDQQKLFKAAQQNQESINADSREILAAIRKCIESVSYDPTKIVEKANRKKRFNLFIKQATQNKQLLMVRSTGREDTQELSNAGGNASVASVPPNNTEISNAIKTVLSSYFSEKSIEQRLIGKDKRLFSDPFMAILLQVMIGENSGGTTEIPYPALCLVRKLKAIHRM